MGVRGKLPARHFIAVVCGQGGVISFVFFSLYVNNMPSHSHHVVLALYSDDTAIIAMSHKQTLLVSCLESYLNDL